MTDLVELESLAGPVRVQRDPNGIPHITAPSPEGAHFGLGYCHARDRGMQMLLVRILGRGRACELLQDNDEMLAVDKYFRRWNLGGDAVQEEAALSAPSRAAIEAYRQGANLWFEKKGVPWELRLLGCRFEPWSVADMFLTAKVAGLITLAQSQADMEQFIIECVQHGISREKLEELFPGKLGGLDEELLRKVTLQEPMVPPTLKWASGLPRMLASNNWVVAGAKSASGKPLLCNDPHLEINRLPAIWYEAVLRWPGKNGNDYVMGATFPGLPGVSIGRTRYLAWGITYAFMDAIDSWVEDCRDGKYRRGDDWLPFRTRKETIRRKKHPPLELTVYENDHGVLGGDPNQPGCFLTTRWSCGAEASACSFEATHRILGARTVPEGQAVLGRICNSAWNWVLADTEGNIGYQMSGKMPKRREGVSGLVPLAGWDPANDWQGFYAPEELPRALNPPEGFITTANQDLNHLGKASPISVAMAAYRAERIASQLSQPGKIDVEAMQKLQLDLYSPQAEQFMAILRPLLAEFDSTRPESVGLLREWDLRYASDSRAAFIFEEIYQAVTHEVFGHNEAGFGQPVLENVLKETCIFYDFYGNFDAVLLAEQSCWFGARSRADIYRAALRKGLAVQTQPYGHTRRVRMRHLLLGGKLPLWFGFDRNLELPGNRATIHQGQIFRGGGRELSFAPSFRMVTDMASDTIHTTLAGGASDRRFSKWYINRLQDWLDGRYSPLSAVQHKPSVT